MNWNDTTTKVSGGFGRKDEKNQVSLFFKTALKMTFNDFKQSLSLSGPSSDCPILVKALWYDAKGQWDEAHDIAQSREGTRDYDRLHAYLHRKEGDQWNAGYWYRRARAEMPLYSLEQEWEELVKLWLWFLECRVESAECRIEMQNVPQVAHNLSSLCFWLLTTRRRDIVVNASKKALLVNRTYWPTFLSFISHEVFLFLFRCAVVFGVFLRVFTR